MESSPSHSLKKLSELLSTEANPSNPIENADCGGNSTIDPNNRFKQRGESDILGIWKAYQ
ncbi:hypothetical protein ACP6JD_008134 [Aspergillus fumigatus]